MECEFRCECRRECVKDGLNEVNGKDGWCPHWPHRQWGAGGSLRSTPDPWLTHPVALALLAILPSLTFHEQSPCYQHRDFPAASRILRERKSWFTWGIHGEWDGGVARGSGPGPQPHPSPRAPVHPPLTLSTTPPSPRGQGRLQEPPRPCQVPGAAGPEHRPGLSTNPDAPGLEAGVQPPGVGRAAPPEVPRRICSSFWPAPGPRGDWCVPGRPAVCRTSGPSSSLCKHLSPGQIFPFHPDPSPTGLRPIPTPSSKFDFLQRPSSQMSHVQGVGGLGLQHLLGGAGGGMIKPQQRTPVCLWRSSSCGLYLFAFKSLFSVLKRHL